MVSVSTSVVGAATNEWESEIPKSVSPLRRRTAHTIGVTSVMGRPHSYPAYLDSTHTWIQDLLICFGRIPATVVASAH